MEMDDRKRRRNMILYVLIAFVVYLASARCCFPIWDAPSRSSDRLFDICDRFEKEEGR